MGGAVAAIEAGYVQKEIQDSAYKWQKEVENEDRIIVGVNKFQIEEPPAANLLRVDSSAGELQKKKLELLRKERDNEAVKANLKKLEEGCKDENVNLMPIILDCVKSYATLGEICRVMRDVFGEYTPHVTL